MTVIELPFPPSTNNMFINGSKGRFRSQKYDEWIKEAGWELTRQRPAKHVGPVVLSFEFGEPDKRKRDITNLLKAPEDLLVKHGVIEADDGSIVRGVEAHWNAFVKGVKIVVVPVASAYSETSPQRQHDAEHEHSNPVLGSTAVLYGLRCRG